MSEYLETKDHFNPPPKSIVNFLARFSNWYFEPEYIGLNNLHKDKPGIYVSNHTLLGITDGPLYIPKLYNDLDIYLRVLVDNMHKSIPLWRSIMTDYGAVTGSREHARALMEAKQHILVFPGGTNEICKTKGNEYTLMWKERYGFIKMAIENAYPIYPIASLGGDELYDILYDKDDFVDSKIGKWFEEKGILEKYFKGGENIPPLVKGIGPTLFPKPKKIYYKFCKPISTAKLKGKATEKQLKELREDVEHSIYEGIHELTEMRSQQNEEDQHPIRKFLNSL